ncbi:MAG: hypothetical protein COB60_04225 [Flavobacteriaceae bacterium]|nr:MAG: hypothetical protein COB60_04225 [Flavobacteriaceae bacterium]
MSEHYEYDKKITASILKDIEEHKVHIVFIESDGYNPGFGYSIGLVKEFNHPELIIIGLNPESTGAIINNAKDEIEKGTKFIEGINYPGFLVELPVQFLEVKKEHYPDYLGYAGWYNDNSIDFPSLQIVWTDREGIFPWESEFNENFKFKQPLLDRNTEFKFLEERNLGVFTTSDVLEGKPVKYVYHNEDGDWQFQSEQDPDLNKAKLVCLEELVKKDSTLNEIYYLNYGESAERESVGEKWKIFEK